MHPEVHTRISSGLARIRRRQGAPPQGKNYAAANFCPPRERKNALPHPFGPILRSKCGIIHESVYLFMLRVGIVGYRGYSGAELVHLLRGHKQVEPILMDHREDPGS